MTPPPRKPKVKPYYSDSLATIYHGNSEDIISMLGVKFDLMLTDPPYGINQDKGFNGGGYSFAGKKRNPKRYSGEWDNERPTKELLDLCLNSSNVHIIWGGNYLADILPQRKKWLVWDKQQTMPTFSDAELAWTSLSGDSVKMFRYCGAGMLAKEKERFHPTQKPLNLMLWCLNLIPEANTILDPFGGSGTTARACKDLGKKCVLIERSEEFCEVAAKRLSQESFLL